MNTLYETDIYAWSLEQIQALKNHKYDELDYDHLIEEIEALGDSQRDSVYSHMVAIISHLLKIKYSKIDIREYNLNKWFGTVDNSRIHLKSKLKKHRSLIKYFESQIQDAFEFSKEHVISLDYIEKDKLKEEYLDKWTSENIIGISLEKLKGK